MTPAEHRAEAEDLLIGARTAVQDRAMRFALLAIGHAILAGLPPERPTLVVNLAGNPSPEEVQRIRDAIRARPEDAA